MANIDNECKDLKVNELHTEAMKNGVDTFAAIYNHQKEMQENTYGFDFEKANRLPQLPLH